MPSYLQLALVVGALALTPAAQTGVLASKVPSSDILVRVAQHGFVGDGDAKRVTMKSYKNFVDQPRKDTCDDGVCIDAHWDNNIGPGWVSYEITPKDHPDRSHGWSTKDDQLSDHCRYIADAHPIA
ncbi:hypothetical protein THASP1DRAFT_22593 [Thamnocephalis sphaerospora]|uniref:Uncharacterized protein n=1 Tax=Thamnocephalis sphaerospora TaxID=78915 RepID=A0A4P9XTR7_9FUNG|nr:hypothetical protein THASP1DRAFT_22593 [Thamnocephalis sphaerospora]|eukprot:RKP09578.1 hypothetical protein THASP1DRAFT_22593 [Thamnocephalis sphaerospora]